jgi:hypothetical protein
MFLSSSQRRLLIYARYRAKLRVFQWAYYSQKFPWHYILPLFRIRRSVTSVSHILWQPPGSASAIDAGDG